MRSCEGTLKKRGHALFVTGLNAIALTSASALNAKLSLRPTPPEQLAHQTQPRAVMRVATRGSNRDSTTQDISLPGAAQPRANSAMQDLYDETVNLRTQLAALQDLGHENDYALGLARVFGAIRLANRSAAEGDNGRLSDDDTASSTSPAPPPAPAPAPAPTPAQPMSRNARRRMRQRMRMALNEDTPATSLQNGHVQINIVPQSAPQSAQINLPNGPSTSANSQNTNQTRNKKKRRQRK